MTRQPSCLQNSQAVNLEYPRTIHVQGNHAHTGAGIMTRQSKHLLVRTNCCPLHNVNTLLFSRLASQYSPSIQMATAITGPLTMSLNEKISLDRMDGRRPCPHKRQKVYN